MDQDHPLNPVAALSRRPQCSCGVTLRRFTVTGTGSTRQIALTPAPAEPHPAPPGAVVAWALSTTALLDWCAGRPPTHDILDDQGQPMRWSDHAPPPGTRYTCAACGATDQPYLTDEAVCPVCAAYVPLVLEFHSYTARDPPGRGTPQGPSPAQQLNAVLLDYAIQPNDVIHLLPEAGTPTNGVAPRSLIAMLSVRRHVAGHILHHLAAQAG